MQKQETKNPDLKPQMENILLTLFSYTSDSGEAKNFESLINNNSNVNNDKKNQNDLFKKIIMDMSSSFNLSKIKNEKYQIYNKKYTKNEKNELIYKISKIILFTYRKNFPQIINSIGEKFISDTGWGCMLRCGQMLLARAIYKLLKIKNISSINSIHQSIEFFFEKPISFGKIPDNFVNMMNHFLKFWYQEHKNNIFIKEILPPLSIKTICSVGRICNKEVGEWFSDVNICYIFNIINEYFHLFNDLKIFNFQSSISLNQIINNCFDKESNFFNENDYILNDKEEKLYFTYQGIVFVSIRLGIDNIPKEYYESLKEIFSCKNCLGIIGGKNKRAYYFIGYDDKGNLLYLDPHFNKECVVDLELKTIIKNFLVKDVYNISIKKISPAFSVGFIFRNFKEYNEFIQFIENYTQQSFPCFGIIQNKKKIISKYKELKKIEKNINNDKDDF